jgi:hypothetical protein
MTSAPTSRSAAGYARELGRDLTLVEPVELHPAHHPHPLPPGDQRPQRVTPVKLVGTVGGHQQDPGVAQRPDEEGDELQRGLVGPVQVLEHEKDRLAGAQPGQQPEHQLHKLRRPDVLGVLGGRVRGQFRQQPGETTAARPEQPGELAGRRRPRQRPQRPDQRGQRQPIGAKLDAVPGEHRESGAGRLRGKLFGQPGLADACLAADERQRRLAGPGPVRQPSQQREFAAPPDEDRALRPRVHN